MCKVSVKLAQVYVEEKNYTLALKYCNIAASKDTNNQTINALTNVIEGYYLHYHL